MKLFLYSILLFSFFTPIFSYGEGNIGIKIYNADIFPKEGNYYNGKNLFYEKGKILPLGMVVPPSFIKGKDFFLIISQRGKNNSSGNIFFATRTKKGLQKIKWMYTGADFDGRMLSNKTGDDKNIFLISLSSNDADVGGDYLITVVVTEKDAITTVKGLTSENIKNAALNSLQNSSFIVSIINLKETEELGSGDLENLEISTGDNSSENEKLDSNTGEFGELDESKEVQSKKKNDKKSHIPPEFKKYSNEVKKIFIHRSKNDSNKNSIICRIQYWTASHLPKKSIDRCKIEGGRKVSVSLKSVSDSDYFSVEKLITITNFDIKKDLKVFNIGDLKKEGKLKCNLLDDGKFNCIYDNFIIPNYTFSTHNQYKNSSSSIFLSLKNSQSGNDIDSIGISIEEEHSNKPYKLLMSKRQNKNYEYKYLINTLPKKLYPEYKNVSLSKNEWNNLSLGKKEKTLYWEGQKLKDFNGKIIDDVQRRFMPSRDLGMIYEMHNSANGYNTSFLGCMKTSLLILSRFCSLSAPRFQEVFIEGSNIFSARFSPKGSGFGNGSVGIGKAPDGFEEIPAYQSIESVYKKQREEYGIKRQKVFYPDAEISVSKIPGDFSPKTSCTYLNIGFFNEIGIIGLDGPLNKCFLKPGEMYYLNIRAVMVDGNYIKKSDCSRDKLCFIHGSKGNFLKDRSKYPIVDFYKDFSKNPFGKSSKNIGPLFSGPNFLEQVLEK